MFQSQPIAQFGLRAFVSETAFLSSVQFAAAGDIRAGELHMLGGTEKQNAWEKDPQRPQGLARK